MSRGTVKTREDSGTVRELSMRRVIYNSNHHVYSALHSLSRDTRDADNACRPRTRSILRHDSWDHACQAAASEPRVPGEAAADPLDALRDSRPASPLVGVRAPGRWLALSVDRSDCRPKLRRLSACRGDSFRGLAGGFREPSAAALLLEDGLGRAAGLPRDSIRGAPTMAAAAAAPSKSSSRASWSAVSR